MIKRLHSALFYASNLKATADFYRKCGFAVEETPSNVHVRSGDFTLAFLDENTTPIKNESGKTPKGLGIYTYVEVDDVDEHDRVLFAREEAIETIPLRPSYILL
jgi:catechol 2,3-dioxygenase-like lactoylglutathione lyase family enzyme